MRQNIPYLSCHASTSLWGGSEVDRQVVKVGGIIVIVGGFLAMLPTISLALMIIALGAGLALFGFGME